MQLPIQVKSVFPPLGTFVNLPVGATFVIEVSCYTRNHLESACSNLSEKQKETLVPEVWTNWNGAMENAWRGYAMQEVEESWDETATVYRFPMKVVKGDCEMTLRGRVGKSPENCSDEDSYVWFGEPNQNIHICVRESVGWKRKMRNILTPRETEALPIIEMSKVSKGMEDKSVGIASIASKASAGSVGDQYCFSYLYDFPTDRDGKNTFSLLKCKRVMALRMNGPNWLLPECSVMGNGSDPSQPVRLDNVRLCLYERTDGMFCVLIPLLYGKSYSSSSDTNPTTTFRLAQLSFPDRSEGTMRITVTESSATSNCEFGRCLVGCGTNPLNVVHTAIRDLCNFLKTKEYVSLNESFQKDVSMDHYDFEMREDKPKAKSLFSGLGWCTWNAFYKDVSEKKIIDFMDDFTSKGGMTPSHVLIDDGWQDVDWGSMRLMSYNANDKFPKGLKNTVSVLKSAAYGVEYVGVWHAFEGYWKGVSENRRKNSLTNSCIGMFSSDDSCDGYIPKLNTFKLQDMNLPDFADSSISNFYNGYHKYLSCQGVNFVKVDNQCGIDSLPYWVCANKRSATKKTCMFEFQDSLQLSVNRNFGLYSHEKSGQVTSVPPEKLLHPPERDLQKSEELIHCMCHSIEILFNLKNGNCIRTSDDYFPDQKSAGHVYENIKTSILSRPVTFGDWDMFFSFNAEADFHAASRAISGGPVYIADEIGKTNFDVLKKLGGYDLMAQHQNPAMHMLVYEYPAVISLDCVFVDCQVEPKALKICNLFGSLNAEDKQPLYAVMAAFNCYNAQGGILDYFSINDVLLTLSSDTTCSKSVSRLSSMTSKMTANGCAIFCYKDRSCHFASRTELDRLFSVHLKDKVSFDMRVVSAVKQVNNKVLFAPFGLGCDTYNGAGAVVSWKVNGADAVTTYNCYGEEYIFFSTAKPSKCVVRAFSRNHVTSDSKEWVDLTSKMHFFADRKFIAVANEEKMRIDQIVLSF
eukprot:Nk52_evm10s261 gene=Nk52_evmTU10s261